MKPHFALNAWERARKLSAEAVQNAARAAGDLAKAAPPPIPLYELRPLDAEALAAFDRLLPPRFALWTVGAPTLRLEKDGVPLAELAPCDAGMEVGGDLPLVGYELLCAQYGTDDTGECDDRHLDAAETAIYQAMPHPNERASAVKVWRGEIEQRIRQAEAVGRAYLAPPAFIERVTGRKYVPRKSLIPTGALAARLDEQRKEAERTAKLIAEGRAARATEEQRPRTMREHGWHGIEIRRDAIERPPARIDVFPVQWQTPDGRLQYACWEAIEELAPPLLDLQTFRVLPDSFQVPRGAAPAIRPHVEVVTFIRELLALDGRLDSGPVVEFTGSIDSPEARAVLERYGRYFYGCTTIDEWRRAFAAELLVRREAIRPDHVADAIWRRILEIHDAKGPPTPYDKPCAAGRPGAFRKEDGRWYETVRPALPPVPEGAWKRASIEATCVAAVSSGIVAPKQPARQKKNKGHGHG
jgi:hypothetical protein